MKALIFFGLATAAAIIALDTRIRRVDARAFGNLQTVGNATLQDLAFNGRETLIAHERISQVEARINAALIEIGRLTPKDRIC